MGGTAVHLVTQTPPANCVPLFAIRQKEAHIITPSILNLALTASLLAKRLYSHLE
jgi:hypothetical protein